MSFLIRIKDWFTKKRLIWTLIVLVIGVPIFVKILKGDNPADKIQTVKVEKQDIKSTVLATGQVVSETDLNLSFKTSGIVEQVLVKEGEKVKPGQILARLSQRDQLATLTSARGALAQAQANYNKVLAGASNEDITAMQVALENAKVSLINTKKQQETVVSNAYSTLLNTPFQALASTANVGSASVTISGTFIGTEQGVYKISVYNTGSEQKFQISGLENGDGLVKTIPVPLGTKGLYIQFSGTVYSGDVWTINIPNTLSSSYVTNYNAYQSAVKAKDLAISTAESVVASAQANLDLKKAAARPADLQVAEASILSAQGQVQSALASLENQIISAPSGGTITNVDIKIGELATALKTVIVLQDVNSLHVEANVSESSIANLKVGQKVNLTFDALGLDRVFTGEIQTINPGATVVSGITNYKITAGFNEQTEAIKPGMTANIIVLISEQAQAVAVPQRAIVKEAGKNYVRVITDTKTKSFKLVEVGLGMPADGGLVEVVSGLQVGDEIVTVIKDK
jgi:HlyD family secretion protein